MTTKAPLHIAIIGGTGALGTGLAVRWALAGHRVTLGSRDAARAKQQAAVMVANAQVDRESIDRESIDRGSVDMKSADTGGASIAGAVISGTSNAQAAEIGDIVVVAVPYSHHRSTLESIRPHLKNKILIDVTVPLMPPKVRTVQLPAEGSLAKGTQAYLGKEVKVVSAFQNVAATHLSDLDHEINCDVLVCGNDKDARAAVIDLAKDAGMKAWHAGRIDNSAVAEALTSALIFINGHYKIDGAGIRISGASAAAQKE